MVSKYNRQHRRPLLRVRTGCLTCRARKKKCDEGKPVCKGCTRNGVHCQWPDDTPIEPLKDVRSPRKSLSSVLSMEYDFSSRIESHPSEDPATAALTSERNSSPPHALCSNDDLFSLDPDDYMDENIATCLDTTRDSIDSVGSEFGFQEAASLESPRGWSELRLPN